MDARPDFPPSPFPRNQSPDEEVRRRAKHSVQRLIALMLGTAFLVLVARAFRSEPPAPGSPTQGATKLVQRAADSLAARARLRSHIGVLRTPTLTVHAYAGRPGGESIGNSGGGAGGGKSGEGEGVGEGGDAGEGPFFDVFDAADNPLAADLTLAQLRERFPQLATEPITAFSPDGSPITNLSSVLRAPPPADATNPAGAPPSDDAAPADSASPSSPGPG